MLETNISHTFTDSVRKKFIELGFPTSTSGQLSKTILPFKIDHIEKKVFARCDNFFYLEQIIKPYQEEIHDIVKKCWGDSFVFEIDNNSDIETTQKNIETESSLSALNLHLNTIPAFENDTPSNYHEKNESLNYSSHFNFKNFISCESNEDVLSVCKYTAKNFTKISDPLFIYSQTGLGKTHLLHAIANEILQKNKNIKSLYVTTHDFINEVIHQGIRVGKMEEVRKKYKSLDVLLIDDIQMLEKKSVCQTEFFYIINSLLQRKKLVIMTSNKSPKDFKHIDASLKSRFLQGALLEIHLPNLNDRISILQAKSKSLNLELTPDLISYMASLIKTNIREMEGMLTDIGFKSQVFKKFSVSKNLIATTIQQRLPNCTMEKENNLDILQKKVCKYFNVQLSELKGKQRHKNIVLARHITIYIAKEIYLLKTRDILDGFNRKHHKIVMYATNKIKKLLEIDSTIKEHIENNAF